MLLFGLEHEFALIRPNGVFADFTNTTFEDIQPLIDEMPEYPKDYPGLRVGDLGIKKKRWYIEGFERFSETGKYLQTNIKGIEIRTPISRSIDNAVNTLLADFKVFNRVAQNNGYATCNIGLNPFQTQFIPHPPLNTWENQRRQTPEEVTAYIHMLTYGPDVSFSNSLWDDAKNIDIAQKLTYYSPFIVPFSFSSPFFGGKLWDGLSYRTHYRTGARPAALVFLHDNANMITSNPSLTQPARVPAEAGRIEFKAYDNPLSIQRFAGLLALVLGLGLDSSLLGRRLTPDAVLHQRSAKYGFTDEEVYHGAMEALTAAQTALKGTDMEHYLFPLKADLLAKISPAHALIEQYNKSQDIYQLLRSPA